jgi:hypothetical protein
MRRRIIEHDDRQQQQQQQQRQRRRRCGDGEWRLERIERLGACGLGERWCEWRRARIEWCGCIVIGIIGRAAGEERAISWRWCWRSVDERWCRRKWCWR